MLPLLHLAACLERVTGQPEPLDPRFYAAAEAAHGGGPDALGEPWADHAGETITVIVSVLSDLPNDVQFDVAVPDKSAPGGVKRIGTLVTSPNTEVTLKVPVEVESFGVEAFQDELGDGPSDDDPYGAAPVAMKPAPPTEPVTITLVRGGRSSALSTSAHAPSVAIKAPWADHQGPAVPFRGLARSSVDGEVQVDVNEIDAAAEGGVKRAGQVRLAAPGPFEFNVPIEVNAFLVEVFQDPGNDGPSDEDPYAAQKLETAKLGGAVLFELASGGRAKAAALLAPQGAGEAAPWADAEGARVTFLGEVASSEAGEILVDVAELDATAAGGVKRVGRLVLAAPGNFELEVPATVKAFRAEAFIDRAGDGPSDDDPFGALAVKMVDYKGERTRLQLVAGGRATQGAPDQVGPGSGSKVPWEGATGDKKPFKAEIVAPTAGKIQVDISEIDAAAKGGQTRVGQYMLSGPGPVRFDVPTSVTQFKVEAFQDPAGDGPSETDPYAEQVLAVATMPASVTMELAVGVRGKATGGGGAPQGADLGSGPKVKVGGRIVASNPALVKVDVFKTDATAKGGRSFVTKVEPRGSNWSIDLPVDYGKIEIDAYLDAKGDGPTGDDKHVLKAGVLIGSTPVMNLDLTFD
ncbi:MAG: hypothetical protein FJ102_02590 [Deltaproteobacteria bacterium]|nr:hypothetical protein [Deltaproteobacteria bacterium]